MPGILTQPHAQRLETLRNVRHVSQGEDGSIIFLKREPGTNALVTLFTVSKSWTYTDSTADGGQLPPEVLFELQIAETVLTKANLQGAAAVKHGQRVFQIRRPSPYEPTGLQRFWRFWLSPVEEV